MALDHHWEYTGGFFDVKGVSTPVAVSVFPGEQYQAPRSWAERAYSNLIDCHQLDEGGRFAAWEQPRRSTDELRAAFRSLRWSTTDKDAHPPDARTAATAYLR